MIHLSAVAYWPWEEEWVEVAKATKHEGMFICELSCPRITGDAFTDIMIELDRRILKLPAKASDSL